jgi:hypothetical protein
LNSTEIYVLVQTESRVNAIARELRTVPGIIVAEDIHGPYDAIALARSDSSEHPIDGVIYGDRELPGVARTISAPLLHSATLHSSTELGDDEAV